jgi:photosystem II stability/assembly factor-like uncharacterized protein
MPVGGTVKSVAEAHSNTNVIYVVCDRLRVFVTTNAGPNASWTTITPNTTGFINGVIVDPSNSATAYLACDVGVYKTTNTGASWTLLQAPANLLYQDIAIDPDSTQHVYAAAFAGIYSSMNGGGTWSNITAGIPQGMEVTSLSFNRTSHKLAASTYGRGAYILDVGQ